MKKDVVLSYLQEALLDLAFNWTTFLSKLDILAESFDYSAPWKNSCPGQMYTVQVIMHEIIKQQACFKT